MDTPGRIAELERKFAENPRRYFAALANEFRKQGDLDHAIELCETHLAEQRNHLSGHVVLAQALVDAGRESEAWDPLHTALDLDPENFIALRLIGELFARVGDQDQARTYFFRALEIEPRNDQLLDAVKNLSQRPVPEPSGEQPEPAAAERDAANVDAPALWGDATPLPGVDSSIALEAESAAEPVAEEVPSGRWSGEPRPDAVGEELSGELPSLEPVESPGEEPPAEERGARAAASEEEPADRPSESAAAYPDESALSDWLPVADGAAEPTPGEDWVSAAGSVAEEGTSDWDAAATEEPKPARTDYDYHDWLPPLESSTDQVGSDEAAAPAEATPSVAPTETAAAAGPEEPVEPDAPAEPAGFTEPTPDEPRPALASETMADLYLQQGHVSLAVEVLRELVGNRPDDERLRARLADLEAQPAAPPRETVRDMFARFARTSQPLRQSAHRDAGAHRTDADETPESGLLADFFAGVPAPVRGSQEPADALLAMLAPLQPAPADEDALGRWLGALRGS